MRFKHFLDQKEQEHMDYVAWERLLHHIAEEELISCKVMNLDLSFKNRTYVLKVFAQCNDKPRKMGLQDDLSEKLNARMENHKNTQFQPLECEVYNTQATMR